MHGSSGLQSANLGSGNSFSDRMLVVQFSRMEKPAPAKGDAAVLWQRWRLVNDKELYDLSADASQWTDVFEQHPNVVAKLRAHYDAWWAKIVPRVNEHSAITVGKKENPVQLSPADWEDSFMDQGSQVRAGLRRNGHWNLNVARAGGYEIELRRWPREADAPIAASLPSFANADGESHPGVALPIASARLNIGGLDQTRPVAASDKAVKFTTKLNAGPAKLQTWFTDSASQEICGAYYVYVERK